MIVVFVGWVGDVCACVSECLCVLVFFACDCVCVYICDIYRHIHTISLPPFFLSYSPPYHDSFNE